MASASSLHSSMAFRYLSPPHTERIMLSYPGASLILPRHSLSSSVLTFARRRSKSDSAITSSSPKKMKQTLPKKSTKKDGDLDEDAFEALFSMLAEDLKNDDLSLDAGDDDISEEDLIKLERELEEALGDDELFGVLDATEDDNNPNDAEEEEDDDDDDEEEEPVKLKNWQLRRLAHALKNGRRKTSIKNLAAELCLDRAVVLELLRDPPPNLLMMSAALPDKPVPTILETETEHEEEETVATISSLETDTETVSLEETETTVKQSDSQVKKPIHVMHGQWASQKRLKKVQVETLERVYRRTKRPTNTMISSIVHVTNLPRKKIVKWFEDKRVEEGVPGIRLPYQRSASESVESVFT